VVDVYLEGDFTVAVAFGVVVICKRARVYEITCGGGHLLKERFHLYLEIFFASAFLQ
jgi:hypothetical protein